MHSAHHNSGHDTVMGDAEARKHFNRSESTRFNMGPGGSFGEAALFYHCPQVDTVKCVSEGGGELFIINQFSFKSLIKLISKKQLEEFASIIDHTVFGPRLTKDQKETLADALIKVNFKAGKNIIDKNYHGNEFYILVEGKAKMTDFKESTKQKGSKAAKSKKKPKKAKGSKEALEDNKEEEAAAKSGEADGDDDMEKDPTPSVTLGNGEIVDTKQFEGTKDTPVLLGEKALLLGEKPNETVAAVTDCVCFALRKKVLVALISSPLQKLADAGDDASIEFSEEKGIIDFLMEEAPKIPGKKP